MTKPIHNLISKLKNALLLGCVLASNVALAYVELPGGPQTNQLNLTEGVTRISKQQSELHWIMLIICSVVFVLVFGVMFYSIWKHRKSVGHKPAHFHESLTVEILWTAAPFLIIVAMAWPATKMVIDMKDTSSADLTVKVTGMQWKWGYEYLRGEGQGISFVSTLDQTHRQISENGGPKAGQEINDYLLKVDAPLVLPVDKKIRVITTANDVIHTFAIPHFGIMQDAIPGFVRDTWFKAEKVGDYYGQCAKLCGKEHAYMPIHVKILSAEDYTKWVASKAVKPVAPATAPTAQLALK